MANLKDLLKGFEGQGAEALGHITAKAKEMGITIFLDDGDKNIFVPKSRLDQEINRSKNLTETIEAQVESINKLDTLTKDNEKAQEKIASMKDENVKLQKAMKLTSVKTELAEQLSALNCIAPVEDIMAFLNTESLVVNETGNVLGLKEALANIKTSKSYLFQEEPDKGSTDPKGTEGGTEPPKGTGDPGKGATNISFGGTSFKAGAFGKSLGQQQQNQIDPNKYF